MYFILVFYNQIFEKSEEDVEKRERRICYTQSHALYGKDLKGKKFCKFTYEIKNQKLYSIHTNLVREYKEAEIMVDCGFYGGLHFVELDNLSICLNYLATFYGDRIALIRLIDDEVYYEYNENMYVENRLYHALHSFLTVPSIFRYHTHNNPNQTGSTTKSIPV